MEKYESKNSEEMKGKFFSSKWEGYEQLVLFNKRQESQIFLSIITEVLARRLVYTSDFPYCKKSYLYMHLAVKLKQLMEYEFTHFVWKACYEFNTEFGYENRNAA